MYDDNNMTNTYHNDDAQGTEDVQAPQTVYGQTGTGLYNGTGSYGRQTNAENAYRADGYQAESYGQARTYQNNVYGQQAGSYQYSSSYLSGTGSYDNIKKEKKEKKSGFGNYMKKVLISVSLGLFFGLCAGFSMYAVGLSTGMINGGNDAQAEEVKEVAGIAEDAADMAKKATGAAQQAAETGTNASEAGEEDQISMTQVSTAVVTDVTGVVASVMPAVVSINNTYTQTISYFGQSMSSEAKATGSGFIVGENDTELLIVTNYHVIEDADTLSVQFVEGSEVEASVKGTDMYMDVAVIAVPIEDIKSSTLDQIAIATLGDSDALMVGEPAIAIGNALGYGQSVTTGVVSALNREMTLSDGTNGSFIQTDAAINPGNSGGALLNIKGEVIGINFYKIGGSVVEGMGYAIPISAVSPIIADMMLRETKSKVAEDERGILGISGITVTEEVSSSYGLPEGVYIAQVYEGTAAAAAGLERGDIITSFDGLVIRSMDELHQRLEYYAKGDTVELTIMKPANSGYRSTKVMITLGDKVTQ